MGLAARAAKGGVAGGVAGGAAVLVCLLVVGLALWRWAAADPVGERLEGTFLDLRFRLRGPLPAPESAVIVAVDEQALGRIGAYQSLRAALARALTTIAAAGPRVIALDILLVDRTGADGALATAIQGAAPVLLAVGTTGPAQTAETHSAEQALALERSALPVVIGQPAGSPAPRLVLPNARLAGAGLLAHVNVAPDAGGAARAIPLAVPLGDGRLLPSMALGAARFGLDAGRGELVHWGGGAYRIGPRTVVPDDRGRLVLDHYGPPGTIRTVGLLAVLEGGVAPEALAGRMVFVGSTAPSLRDAFATPFGSDVAGVEVLATAAANMVEGRAIEAGPAAFATSTLLALAAGLGTVAAFRIRRMALALAAGVACWLATLAAVQAAFAGASLWLDAVTVIGALAVATLVGGWLRMRHESRGRENLAHYIAPSLVSQLSQGVPSFDGREQPMGILFVDVAGYSTMAETGRPAEIAGFLRSLHAFFEAAAERHHGLIVDFQGDGALLVFGLPEPSPDQGRGDAANALACGAMLIAERRQVRAPLLDGPVGLRVSVHWGPVAVGVLGGRRHAKVSVSGDPVNVAARLQEVAKAHGVPFVVSRAVLDAAGQTTGFRPLATEPLRGRRGQVEIWAAALA